MNTQLNTVVLEARFDQLALVLLSGDAGLRTSLGAVGAQAVAALRWLDATEPQPEISRLGRSASRLARRLTRSSSEAAARADGITLEHSILRLGIERGRRLEPLLIAATVRSVLDGSAELCTIDTGTPTADDEPADALATLFTQIALVAVLARAKALAP